MRARACVGRTTVLSDADLADIYAYLQSVPKPPADITLLK
jgi:hypothetical protein